MHHDAPERIYRITLEYTDASGLHSHPSKWDWATLITEDDDESLRLIDAEEITATQEG